MDCNKCVCGLVCRYAQDASYREQIRNGVTKCCDFFPRPDDSVKEAIRNVSQIHKTGINQDVYVIEECSELIRELTKKQRGKGVDANIIEEACDVLGTTLTLLYDYGISPEFIKKQILYKCNRALERYKQNGEI